MAVNNSLARQDQSMKLDGKVIDKATGEVVADSVPEHAGKVIDLRTAKQA